MTPTKAEPSIERLRELLELDEATGVLHWKMVRPGAKSGGVAGCKLPTGYLQVKVDGKKLQAHRVVFALVHGHFPRLVDHINGVRHDNRPANLRAASYAENNWNYRIPSTNTSGVKGVYWNGRWKKWQATVRVNGRRISVGYFSDLQIASKAINSFREEHHKEFARHA